MTIWQPAYIGLGSNLDDPRTQVLGAAERIAAIPRTVMVLRSPLYGSRPMGPADQPNYVNAVAGILTQLDSRTLLTHLKGIESAAGRPDRHPKWGPRVIDLDVLV